MYAIVEQLDNVVQRRYNRWKQAEMPPYLKKELIELKSAEITDRFYKYLEYGSDGIQGKVGVGTNRMNIFTLRRVSQGLADEIKARGFAAQQRGVVIGYDSRYFSRGFAEQAALVLAHNHIKAYLFEQARPTSVLAFAVRWLHAAAGIVLAAGNYAAVYNGCRIYSDIGIPIQDDAIGRLTHFMSRWHDGLKVETLNPEEALKSGRLIMVGSEIDEAYLEYMQQVPLSKETNQLLGASVRIVFTPLQSAAGEMVKNALEQAGFTELYPVPEQQQLDLFFSALNQPDPYLLENLKPAFTIARRTNADMILSVNPEASELSLSVKTELGKYELLTASQTAALLVSYMFLRKSGQNNLPPNGIVLRSVLAQGLADEVITHYGLLTAEVTSGFRQIAAQMASYDISGSRAFLFGYEEDGGYTSGGFVRDKDAVQTALLIAEMCAYYKSVGTSVYQQLLQLFETFGWFREDQVKLTFAGLEGWQQLRIVMERMRSECPRMMAGLRIKYLYDYRKGEQLDVMRSRMKPVNLPHADILKFILEDGSWYGIKAASAEPEIRLFFGSRESGEQACRRKLAAIRSDVLYTVESII
ncbi:phosphohexomutase domain-containing protein [Paenibacillus tarimensis]|uniref:hypothetical protein n=1 Tax=Paenibacillus tarimensis TaxID=416012 RepID=UPI001F1ADAE8|nr:hypothetical protein [Paenibacillus tarimensis]MCF2944228.1 hypothetical protein [Paenibacillus tarimensis]